MSTTNPCALFSLVSSDFITTVDSGLSYNSSGKSHKHPDEIRLVDPNGEPCAEVIGHGFDSLDVRHEYLSGNVGDTKRMLRHRIVIACDYIGDDIHQQLDFWMRSRRNVLFTPGYGDRTELALRPIPGTSDLTGRWSYSTAAIGNTNFWDDLGVKGYMRASRRVRTPAGEGYVHEADVDNLADPAYPTGDTDGLSGWVLGGAGSASLTRTYETYGFGRTTYTGSMRIVGTNSSSARYVERTTGTPSGDGVVWVQVFVKGKFGYGATAVLINGAAYDTVSLNTGDYSDWTPIWLALYANFSGTTTLRINAGNGAQAATCDFEVGPCFIGWTAGTSVTPPGWPHWKPLSVTGDDYLSVSSFTYPKTGSIFTSFWLPSNWVATGRPMLSDLVYFGSSDAGRLHVAVAPAATTASVTWNRDGSNPLSSAMTLIPGAVNTIAVTWTDTGIYLYGNGALLTSNTTAANLGTAFSTAATLYLFGRADVSCYPLIPLTIRFDKEIWTANEIADMHATMTTAIAIQSIVKARGRAYRIRGIPSTPRVVAGDTHWLGTIELEQVAYDSNLYDATTREPA